MNRSLAALEEVWAQRERARARGELLYVLYLVVLSILVLLVPGLHALSLVLAREDVLPHLLSPAAPAVVGAATLALAAAAGGLGGIRGPALLAPFFTVTLLGSDLPRRRVLGRPWLRAQSLVLGGAALLAAVVALTLQGQGQAAMPATLAFVLACLGGGALIGVAWTLGQAAALRGRRLLVSALALAALAAVLLPGGLGPGGSYPVGTTHPIAWAAVMLSGGALLLHLGVLLLGRMRGPVLLEQSQRWESATLVATTGDMVAVAGTFRALPRRGRGYSALGGGPLPLIYARRDLVAWTRTPDRSALGALAVLGAAALVTLSAAATGPIALVGTVLGALTLWAGSGAFADGIRHAVHTLGAPPLFGQTAAVAALLHSLAPAALLALLVVPGAALTGILGGLPAAATLEGLLLALCLVPVVVAGRVRDAAKGPLPLALTTPMPTAQGDVSVVAIAAWQADALLLVSGAAVALSLVGVAGPIGPVLAAAAATASLTLQARSRMRALGPAPA